MIGDIPAHSRNLFLKFCFENNIRCYCQPKISDIMNMDKIGCFTFMNAEGEAYSREWWNGSDFIENKDFEQRFKEEIEKSKDMYLTIIDYHD